MRTSGSRGSLVRQTVLALMILGSPVLRAAEEPGKDAMAQLIQALYAHSVLGDDPGPALYRALYWLRVTTTLNDLSPTAALRTAWQRNRQARTPALTQIQTSRPLEPAPYEEQLLADWHIACVYGLFTPENLGRLQAGVAPVATDGAYAGRTIEAKKINPAASRATLSEIALGPEDGPISNDAYAHSQRPSAPAAPYIQPVPGYTPARWATPPPTASLHVANTLPPYRMPPGGHDIPMPMSDRPSAPVPAPENSTLAKDPPHILTQDVPFNGLLPTDGKVKIGIAGVSANEISASIVGEKQVLIKAAGPGTHDYYVPSVHNFKVPKTNPVRLPGISNDAYLIKDDSSGPHGTEVRYYYIDASVNNGSSYRIAKVTGGF